MNDMFISLQKTKNLIDEIFMQTKEPSQSKWLPGGQQKEGIQFAPPRTLEGLRFEVSKQHGRLCETYKENADKRMHTPFSFCPFRVQPDKLPTHTHTYTRKHTHMHAHTQTHGHMRRKPTIISI